MSVYLAYAAVILHVALGYLQNAQKPIFAIIVAVGAVSVSALHFAAGRIERAKDLDSPVAAADAPWVVVGELESIPEDQAVIVAVEGGERVAIFRYDGKLLAAANVCAHQNGLLGEGRIVYGCITCPWRGFQYHPEDGCAPPPFTEKIATYQLKLDDSRVLLDPRPNAPGTPVEPCNTRRHEHGTAKFRVFHRLAQ